MAGSDSRLDLGTLLPEFPIREECLYLDHAAISPLPRPVSRAMLDAIKLRESGLQELGDFSDRAAMSCRHLGAELIGCEGEDISLVPSTSAGLSIIAGGLRWKKGDEILLGEEEFAANVAAWLHLENRGVKIRRFTQKSGRVDLGVLKENLSQKTRLLALSWVSYYSGWVAQLREISRLCQEFGAFLVVDAIQGLGALKMEMHQWKLDAVVADGHKWLLAPEGCALLATSARLREAMEPVLAGWKNVKLSRDSYFLKELSFLEGGRRFESGSISMVSLSGLAAALDLISTTGIGAIQSRIEMLNRSLTRILLSHGWEILSPGSGHDCSGIVAGRPKRVPAEEAEVRLRERHIITAVREGLLRLSPHFYTTTGELEALHRILGKCGL